MDPETMSEEDHTALCFRNPIINLLVWYITCYMVILVE